MIEDDVIDMWAQSFADDTNANRPFVVPWSREPSLADAYRVQDVLFRMLAPARGLLGGHKVAVTAPPMQELFGLTEPLAGQIHAGQIVSSGAVLDAANYLTPQLEFEVAIRVGRTVEPDDAPLDAVTIVPHVGEVMASFEIVDTRLSDLANIGAAALAADRCFCEGAVLGSPVPTWRSLDLAACRTELRWNGAVVQQGITGAAMGTPLAGLAWVANNLRASGRRLEAGQVVLTGSAFAPRPLARGDRAEYEIEGMGTVSTVLAD